MKRPAKEDIEAHKEWLTGVAARLQGALVRHPLLVLFATKWLVQSPHCKGERLPGVRVDYYIPIRALKPLLSRVGRALRRVDGCVCYSAWCACPGRDSGRIAPGDRKTLREAAQWISTNPSDLDKEWTR